MILLVILLLSQARAAFEAESNLNNNIKRINNYITIAYKDRTTGAYCRYNKIRSTYEIVYPKKNAEHYAHNLFMQLHNKFSGEQLCSDYNNPWTYKELGYEYGIWFYESPREIWSVNKSRHLHYLAFGYDKISGNYIKHHLKMQIQKDEEAIIECNEM